MGKVQATKVNEVASEKNKPAQKEESGIKDVNQQVEQTAPAGLRYDVKILSVHPEDTLRATASVNINDEFAIRGVRIMNGPKGHFVSMPSYKAGNGEYKDICFPCTTESRKEFNQAVLTAYEQALVQNQSQSSAQVQETPSGKEQDQSQAMSM